MEILTNEKKVAILSDALHVTLVELQSFGPFAEARVIEKAINALSQTTQLEVEV